jgi:hypothetical protein
MHTYIYIFIKYSNNEALMTPEILEHVEYLFREKGSIYAFIHICEYIHIYTNTYIYTYTCIYTYTHTYTCLYTVTMKR